MTVTLADIERWDPSAVREVSDALGKRGASSDEVKVGLSKLPLIASWQGTGADAARASLDKLSTHLAAHAEEMAAVSAATKKAADEIDSVRQTLQGIYRDAKAERFAVNPTTGAVTSLDKDKPGDPMRFLQQADLETRISKVLADAKAADADLARAITSAGKESTGPTETRPDVRAALSKPLPQDPKQFNELWNKLTPEEKDWLYAQDHNVGNHPGMPFDPADHLGKDHYNRMHLDELMKNSQANVDDLQHRFDVLADQQYRGDHSSETGNALAALGPQLQAAKTQLEGYKAVNAALNPSKDSPNSGIPRYLGLLDDQGHAAVSLQNPDLAKRDATFVPGTGQNINAFEGSNEKSIRMYQAALAADKSLMPGDVSVTTWMGYDRPMNLPEASFTDPATSGAGNLDAFQAGLRASHVGDPSINTVIGHSYGSTLVGAAASGGHHLDANNIIAVGSPGMLVNHAGDLNLDPGGHVYATKALNDVISLATDTTLGPDPIGQSFGATDLMAAPGPSLDPYGILPSVEAHSSYWSPGNVALRNMGAVIAGQPPPVIGYPSG
jgi:hypothetical protein